MKFFAALLACAAVPALAADALTLAGSTATAVYARAWVHAWQRTHPGAPAAVSPSNSAAAPDAMAKSAATIGMMSRPMTDAERARASRGKPPLEFKVALDAVGIFVRKDNPLSSITLEQVEQVFAARPRRGGRAASWSELGVTGPLAQKPLVLFGLERGRGAYDVMRELALGGGEFNDRVSSEPVASSVVQGVAVEPGGIGYASIFFRTARTSLVPVAPAGGDPVAPTEEEIMAGRYPLARYLYLYASASAPEVAREFLRFALSFEGQAMVRNVGGIPISPYLAQEQLAALK